MLVYSFAVIMDAVLASLFFICVGRIENLTHSPIAAGGVLAVWAAAYMLGSFMAGRLVTRRNVGWMLTGACLVVSLLVMAYLYWTGPVAIYVLTGLQGGATAFFFTPFQLFMKLVDEGQNKGVTRSAGLYVFSWSLGYAIGPFMAAFLWERYTWQTCHVINGVACAALTIGTYLVKHHAEARPSVAAAPGASDAAGALPMAHTAQVVDPNACIPPQYRCQNLAWMAWIFCGLGCMLVTMIRGQFQGYGAAYGISTYDQGLTLCLMSAMQGLVGFLLGWGRTWMYRPVILLVFGAFGVLGLALFAGGDRVSVFCLAAMCVGVYSGSFYVYLVVHSLIHPTEGARYVSINEVAVGLAGILGPYLGGVLAKTLGSAVPFAVGAGIIAVAVSVQAALHFASNRRVLATSLSRSGGYDTPHERDPDQTRAHCGI